MERIIEFQYAFLHALHAESQTYNFKQDVGATVFVSDVFMSAWYKIGRPSLLPSTS